jgi:hypothetical protein
METGVILKIYVQIVYFGRPYRTGMFDMLRRGSCLCGEILDKSINKNDNTTS